MLLPLRFHVLPASAWPLGALLVVMGAPARAQSGTAAPVIPAAIPAGPQLTAESRPSSAIAGTHRPGVTRVRQGRSLLMAAPAETLSAPVAPPLNAPVLPSGNAARPVTAAPGESVRSAGAPDNALSGPAAPRTLISPAKRVKVTTKTRFDATQVSTQSLETAPSALTNPPVPSPSASGVPGATKSAADLAMAPSARAAQPLSTVGVVPPSTPSTAPVSTAPASARDRMSRPASRGGLMSQRAPIELPNPAPNTEAISDSQRRLLASLDADLGRAQRRLDRAETSLSEGQRQLGEWNGVLQTAMLDAGPDARGLHPFVRVAQRYMGTPYVWGGESARGFDCSGFIMRVMRDLGYRALPHSAAEQFNYGLPVAREMLKPGDIVFFANTYKPGISHVGIYLGHGRFIHAANSKVGTIVSNLDSPKWVEHYAGARRLLPVKS